MVVIVIRKKEHKVKGQGISLTWSSESNISDGITLKSRERTKKRGVNDHVICTNKEREREKESLA